MMLLLKFLVGDATGNVSATVNGEVYSAPIVDGAALITVPGLAENATAVVYYPGDDKYNNFTESVDIIVNPKEEPVPSKENATMDVSANSPTEGENTTIDVTFLKMLLVMLVLLLMVRLILFLLRMVRRLWIFLL